MSTAELETKQSDVAETPKPTFPVVKFSPTDAAIAKLEREYLPLVIKGPDDKAGFDIVHAARMDVRDIRIACEKHKEKLKRDALDYNKSVDTEFNKVVNRLKPMEKDLHDKEKAHEAEKEEIKRKAEEAKQAVTRERYSKLQACNADFDPMAVMRMSDAEYSVLLRMAQEDHQAALAKAEAEGAERQRLDSMATDRLNKLAALNVHVSRETALGWPPAEFAERLAEAHRAESQRLAKIKEQEALENSLAAERAELDKQREAQEAEAARLQAESRRLVDAENERKHKEELLEVARVARERAVRETEEAHQRELAEEMRRVEASAAQEKEAAQAAEAARARAEALRPDKEKLLSVADAVTAIDVPRLSTDDANRFRDSVRVTVDQCADHIRRIVASMA